MRAFRFLAIPAVLSLAACAHTPAPAYQAGVDSLVALRAAPAEARLAVGDFDAAPDVNDAKLGGMRGSSLSGASSDGLFSTYLQQALETELRQAGRLDPEAGLRLTGTLTENYMNATGSKEGIGRVSARFVLRRGDEVVFDKVLQAKHRWESSFMGAIAIPAAFSGYAATVQKLTRELFADPAFQAALR